MLLETAASGRHADRRLPMFRVKATQECGIPRAVVRSQKTSSRGLSLYHSTAALGKAGNHPPVTVRLARVPLALSPADTGSFAIEAGLTPIRPHPVVSQTAVHTESALRSDATANIAALDIVSVGRFACICFVSIYFRGQALRGLIDWRS